MFGTVKGLFGLRKVRYRGLKKNLAKLWMRFAATNPLKYARTGYPDWKPAVRGRGMRVRIPGMRVKRGMFMPGRHPFRIKTGQLPAFDENFYTRQRFRL
jgi:hypothetical protein